VSGEINYRNFAGTPGKNPKYLSDSLTPWYGIWTGNCAMGYSTLPTGDCIGKVIVSNVGGAWSGAYLTFATPQNVSNEYICDLWLRTTASPTSSYMSLWGVLATRIDIQFGAGIPANWTRYQLRIPKDFPNATPLSVNSWQARQIPVRLSYLLFSTFHAANPHNMEIGGFTIRRL